MNLALRRVGILTALLASVHPYLGAREERFELRGKITLEEESFRELSGTVFLEGATFPFTTSALVGPGGDFRIRDLRAGLYRLVVAIAHRGEMEQTITISASFADERGRIQREFPFVATELADPGATVSAGQLAVPDRARRGLQRAERHLERQNTEAAVRELLRALEIAPRYSAAWNRLGTISYLTGQYADAEEQFEKALEFDPHAYAPLVNVAAAYMALGKMDEALRSNLAAVDKKPDDPLARSQLGQTLFALGRLDEAEEQLLRARELDPAHFSFPQLVLAEIYRQRGTHEALARELDQFLRLHPDIDGAEYLREVLDMAREAAKNPE